MEGYLFRIPQETLNTTPTLCSDMAHITHRLRWSASGKFLGAVEEWKSEVSHLDFDLFDISV